MDNFFKGFEKKANFATKGMGVPGKGTKPVSQAAFKAPQIPKAPTQIRGVTSMKI